MPRAEQPAADAQDLELLKAVAQAWHAQTGNPKPTKEFDAQANRFNFKPRPSRFKTEAMNTASRESSPSSGHWDLAGSLLDSYEIVTLAKKLEANLALDHPMSGPPPGSAWAGKRAARAESKNSLRNLFNKVSSKRFGDAAGVPSEDGDYLIG